MYGFIFVCVWCRWLFLLVRWDDWVYCLYVFGFCLGFGCWLFWICPVWVLLVELFACVGVFTGVDSVFGYDCLLWYCCGLFVSVVWIVLLGVLFEWWVIVLSIIVRHLFTWLCLCYYGDF